MFTTLTAEKSYITLELDHSHKVTINVDSIQAIEDVYHDRCRIHVNGASFIVNHNRENVLEAMGVTFDET